MIRYKVVTTDRKSCSEVFNRLGKNALDYPKNKKVIAPKWSMGIAVFEKRHQAQSFIDNHYGVIRKELMILRVQTITRGRKPKRVFNLFFLITSLKNSYKFLTNPFSNDYIEQDTNFWSVPEGTICYSSVKVLD